MDPRISPETGLPLTRGVREVVVAYKGLQRTVSLPGWYGDDPDDALHSGTDMAVSDRALAEMKIEADKLLAAPDIRRIRTALALTQREASEIIGGGPNAFQKYESGDVLPSKALVNALRLLERHPEDVAFLREVAAS